MPLPPREFSKSSSASEIVRGDQHAARPWGDDDRRTGAGSRLSAIPARPRTAASGPDENCFAPWELPRKDPPREAQRKGSVAPAPAGFPRTRSLGRYDRIVCDGVTIRIRFDRIVGQICSICDSARARSEPVSGNSRTRSLDFAIAEPSSVSPIWASRSRICLTCPAVPRTNKLRVVISASTRGADGSGLSFSSPPKSLVIESTATCGSTVESGITATWRASRCIWSIVARIVACWAGRANATRCPVTGSTASLIDVSPSNSVCRTWSTDCGSAEVIG